jgi:hypothetical protein
LVGALRLCSASDGAARYESLFVVAALVPADRRSR